MDQNFNSNLKSLVLCGGISFAAPADFNSTTASLGFVPGDRAGTSVCADICLVNDIIVEAEEMFTVNLTAVDGNAVRVFAGSATVTILEDTTDGKVTFCFQLQ